MNRIGWICLLGVVGLVVVVGILTFYPGVASTAEGNSATRPDRIRTASSDVLSAAEMIGPDVPTARLNRPLIFLIRDIETDTILFIGQVMDPSARVGRR